MFSPRRPVVAKFVSSSDVSNSGVSRWGLLRWGLVALLAGVAAPAAHAQDGGVAGGPPPPQAPVPPDQEPPPPPPPSRADNAQRGAQNTVEVGAPGATTKKVPCVEPKNKVTMDFADAPLGDVVKYMAQITCRNFILSDDLKGNVTIISHQQVSVPEAYEAFLSALEVGGYTTVTVGKTTKIVATSEAASTPLKVYEGDDIPGTDNFVTQIVTLENVAVQDISSVVKDLAGSKAKIIAYNPTNTLIITDSAYNIRRVYRIIMELDVAAPKSKLEVIPIRYATATDVERILEEVFGLSASSTSGGSASSRTADTSATTRRRRNQDAAAAAAPAAASATSVGSDALYISKIIADERTNSLVVMANEEALKQMTDLIARIDVDIDPASRAQIHVIYLENAKATDISGVLSDLTGGSSGSGGGSSRSSSSTRSTGSTGARPNTGASSRGTGFGGGSGGFGGGAGSFGGGGFPRPPGGAGPDGAATPGGLGGAALGGSVRALEGVRITADENTNSLVIIASPEDYRVLKTVIDRLDIMRRQVFVEAVVLEVGTNDDFTLGFGVHGGKPTDDGGIMLGAAGLGGNSLSFLSTLASSADSLTGLALGLFGSSLEVPITGSDGSSTTVSVPAFGVAINALSSNAEVEILSNPSLLITDNEEAKIQVGRNVPFPVSSGRDNNNNPIISYQREDVGITLKVTPQINEANFVTLDLALEVSEVEQDTSGLDVNTAGFITSKRDTENVVVVKDNQTIVIGGLIGNTATKVATKVPILGDLPLIGVLFRGKSDTTRKTNLLIFLTPHVINDPSDLEEVYRIKWAQRAEFMRRFYGKSREDQEKALAALISGSMNVVDTPSVYREKALPVQPEIEGDMLQPTTSPAAPSGSAPAPAPEPDPTEEP